MSQKFKELSLIKQLTAVIAASIAMQEIPVKKASKVSAKVVKD